MDSIRFGTAIESVELVRRGFRIKGSHGEMHTNTLIAGSGRVPRIPEFALPHRGNRVMHSSEFLHRRPKMENKRVVVIGGGQSGAEIVLQCLGGEWGIPDDITWISRRPNFFALEDSPFVNEWFFPRHNLWFSEQNQKSRETLLSAQKMASDGVSLATLEELYRKIYIDNKFGTNTRNGCHIALNVTVDDLYRSTLGYGLSLSGPFSEQCDIDADLIILATGYQWQLPKYLEPLRHHMEFIQDGDGNEEISVDRNYQAYLDGPGNSRMFIQNGSTLQHGIADANLSLLSMRSARIANTILGRQVYRCDGDRGLINWSQGGPLQAASAISARQTA